MKFDFSIHSLFHHIFDLPNLLRTYRFPIDGFLRRVKFGLSSSSTRRWDYDVFLSLRGEDTCRGFTADLYHALCDVGTKSFMDRVFLRGEEILDEVIEAIERSKFLVIVFSKNYAESKRCLNEVLGK